MLRLYTFTISHFSEKVRWALDFESLEYAEKRLIPGPHMLVVRRRAPATTVPLLEHDGRFIQGSSAIIDYVEQKLGARRLKPSEAQAARSAELEALADHAFGLGVQRILYDVALSDRKMVTDLWSLYGPSWARSFYAVAYPVVASAVRRIYTIRPEAVARAKERFCRAMDEMDRALQERPYLGGDAPGRADVTTAALLAPLCRPPEHLVPWPEIPATLAPFMREIEGRPTWNHALKMYREHRRRAQA